MPGQVIASLEGMRVVVKDGWCELNGYNWEGQAANKAEALQNAEKADPRVDLDWMRIRYERDLNKP